jgi:OOP family OmpA-OmpF porin
MKNTILPLVLFLSLAISSFAQQFAPRYELVKIGKQVNTHYHEGAPVISPMVKNCIGL